MSEQQATGVVTEDRLLLILRVVDAPRELVWRAFTEREHLIQWWGPSGFTNTFYEFDLRPGGVWRFVMHGPDGTDYDNNSRFLEVTRPERIVFDHGTGPDDVMFRSTVTFEAVGEATRVTLRMEFSTAQARDDAVRKYGAIEGGNQTLHRLAAYLETM